MSSAICSQANGSAMKAGGESKRASLALPASKIPAFIPSSRTRALNLFRATNQTSSSKSFIPSLSLSWPSCGPALTPHDPIPRCSRRSKDQNLALPPHAPNVQCCSYSYSSSSSSSSSPTSSPSSLLSPTAMRRGGRAAHADGGSGRATNSPASSTGDMA